MEAEERERRRKINSRNDDFLVRGDREDLSSVRGRERDSSSDGCSSGGRVPVDLGDLESSEDDADSRKEGGRSA